MGPHVHMRLTYQWALEEGFAPEDAERIARADVEVDARYPGSKLRYVPRHFAPAAWWWSRRYFRQALARHDLALLGSALHCAQDAISHGRLGEKHLLLRAGLGRNPDSWELAPPDVRARIEAVTRDRMRRYRAQTL